jgi:predicted transcriptional regulator
MDPEEERPTIMSDSGDKKAHALSLHLYSILSGRTSDGSNSSEIVAAVQEFLKSASIEEHLVVELREGPSKIELKGKSEFGDSMILELYSRCEYFPCPEGECEYATHSFCKACGKLQR